MRDLIVSEYVTVLKPAGTQAVPAGVVVETHHPA